MLATVAMSALMVAGDRAGLMGEQPPTLVTRAALEAAGEEHPSEDAAVLAPLAHAAFGAAGGSVFGLLRRVVPRAPAVPLGIGFGLGIWIVSYAGWIPALGIIRQPGADRRGRVAVMVAAHVVYGATLGLLDDRLNRERPSR